MLYYRYGFFPSQATATGIEDNMANPSALEWKIVIKLLGDSQFETNPDARVDKVCMDDIDCFLVCLF